MKHISALFLKAVILFVGIGVFSGMIWFPQTEGRAANLDLISIYKDPFIIYIYIGSIPFFVGLYQAFKLLNLIEAGKAFSPGAKKSLGDIKLASLSLIGFIVLAVLFIQIFAQGDDPAGPTMLGIIATFICGLIAAVTANFQKRIRNTI